MCEDWWKFYKRCWEEKIKTKPDQRGTASWMQVVYEAADFSPFLRKLKCCREQAIRNCKLQEENVFNVMSEIMQQQLGIYKAETEVKEYINNIINEEVSKYIYIFIDKR